MDAVLEEGAANLEELKVIWGDPDEALDFDGFCLVLSPPASAVSAWYCGHVRWLVQRCPQVVCSPGRILRQAMEQGARKQVSGRLRRLSVLHIKEDSFSDNSDTSIANGRKH